MKKVLPNNLPPKPTSRKVTELISSLVIVLTIVALAFITGVTVPQDNNTASVGNFAIYIGSAEKGGAALMVNVYECIDSDM